mgnify:CR=1 FL=1
MTNDENMFYTILIIIYFLAFGFWTWKNMKLGIYILIFGLPSYLIRFNLGPLPMTVLEGMILILFGIWTIEKLRNKEIKKIRELDFGKIRRWVEKWRGLFGPIILFLLAGSVAVVVSSETQAAMGLWKAYFIEPILFFVVLTSVIKKEDLKNIFWAMAGSSAVVSAVAVYQKVTGNWIANDFWAAEATRRVSGVFPYPNALALYLAPIVILLIGFLVKSWGGGKKGIEISRNKVEINRNKLLCCYIVKLLGWGIVVADLLAVYWSGSKGAIMGIGAGIFFYAVFWKGKRKYFWPVVAIGVVAAVFLWQSGRINLKGNFSVEGGDSISVRQEMWAESWQMIKDHYMLGAGLAGYQEVMAEYHQKKYIEIYLYPHNIIFNFWSETGLLGLLAFLGIIVWFYRRALTKLKNDLGFKIYPPASALSASDWRAGDLRISIAAAMTVVIIHGLVDVPYFKNDLSVFFWLMIGLMWIASAGQKGLRRI